MTRTSLFGPPSSEASVGAVTARRSSTQRCADNASRLCLVPPNENPDWTAANDVALWPSAIPPIPNGLQGVRVASRSRLCAGQEDRYLWCLMTHKHPMKQRHIQARSSSKPLGSIRTGQSSSPCRWTTSETDQGPQPKGEPHQALRLYGIRARVLAAESTQNRVW
jgi:hypothetical protein